MRTYSSGSGWFHWPGPAQPPISPPPMKSVTNSKRVPFQVKRNGQDEGLRSSSVTVKAREAAAGLGDVSACRMPDGHNTRTTSAAARDPSPNVMPDGDTAGDDEEASSTWRRLPALSSILAPTDDRLL